MRLKKELNDEFISLFHQLNQRTGEPTALLTEKPLSDVLNTFEQLNLPDHFYILVDMKRGAVVWSHGIETCLGYTEDVKSEEWLPEKVHPFLRNWYSVLAFGFIKIMESVQSYYADNESRYLSHLPLRKANGSYVSTHRMTKAFQFDKDGNMCSYLSIFTVLGTYKGEAMNPKIIAPLNMAAEDIIFESAGHYVDIDPKQEFTEREFKLLHRCTEIHRESSKLNILLKEFSLSEHTLKRDLLLVKSKIVHLMRLEPNLYCTHGERNCLPYFATTYDAAVFLKDCGILKILTCRYQNYPQLHQKKRN